MRALFGVILFGGAIALSASAADTDEAEDKIVEVASTKAVETLGPAVHSVYLKITLQNKRVVPEMLDLLAKRPALLHLRIDLPNSEMIMLELEDEFDKLAQFETLESLEIRDKRDWRAPQIFEQVTTIPNLRELKMSFW
ncbi:MAG: hypothetical protein HKN23_10435 [Verrucomicrobiales bacterium]|nr:hypothetical protein [Verrucomicrobiales bacterium]